MTHKILGVGYPEALHVRVRSFPLMTSTAGTGGNGMDSMLAGAGNYRNYIGNVLFLVIYCVS